MPSQMFISERQREIRQTEKEAAQRQKQGLSDVAEAC